MNYNQCEFCSKPATGMAKHNHFYSLHCDDPEHRAMAERRVGHQIAVLSERNHSA